MKTIITLDTLLTLITNEFEHITNTCIGNHACTCKEQIDAIIIPRYGLSIHNDFHYLDIVDDMLVSNFILEYGEHIESINEV